MQTYAFRRLPLLLATALLALADTAQAGQFKRLNASGLAVGGQIAALASPQNQGAAMEMDVYEFQTPTNGGSFRCRILTNTTGQTLNLRFIGVNGTIIASCAAANNGSCDAGTFSLVGNLLFQCLVATQNGAPVIADARYTFVVERPTAFAPADAPEWEDDGSGVQGAVPAEEIEASEK